MPLKTSEKQNFEMSKRRVAIFEQISLVELSTYPVKTTDITPKINFLNFLA